LQGLQGLHGLAAAQGLQGLQGLHGLAAAQGLQGLHGLQGLQGLQAASCMAPTSAWAAAAGRIAALESAIAVLRTMAVSLMVFRVNFDILGSPNSSSN
jgi:hypothetical protein